MNEVKPPEAKVAEIARKTPEAAPPKLPAPTVPTADGRKVAGKLLAVIIICAAVVLVLWVWGIVERHPRTDDAVARANVVAIVPRVRGQIVKLCVEDNQAVKEGDLLFEIDPDDYKLALEKANADLESLDKQIEVARGQDAELKFAVKAAEAGVESGNAQLKQASDTLRRLEPLLPRGFATAEQVDQAWTAKEMAVSGLAADEQRLNQAKASLSALETLTAQRPGAMAAVHLAELELSYCEVRAPFPGRVISLNISAGAYASAGIPVFSLLDTRRWYVMANFREGEIRYMAPGTVAEVYLMSAPERRFRGKVQGIGWAVEPEDELDLPHSLPYVKRELNWVHVAQRFPVRIEVEDPDPDLFRMGESAVAIIKGSGS
jgi:multidrug efflux system membrane fusion protein